MTEAETRAAVIATARAMNASGLNHGTSGNVSARHGDGFLITPTGVPYDRLTPDMIVMTRADGSFDGVWRPSSEWRMHADIYTGRAEAGAVVHCHSDHATALATLREGIPAFHYMVAVAGGTDIRCARYETFGSAALSQAMLIALEGRRACLLGNHGQIVFERTLDRALWLAGEVEGLARQYLIARSVGAPTILDAEEMARVLDLFAGYGQQ